MCAPPSSTPTHPTHRDAALPPINHLSSVSSMSRAAVPGGTLRGTAASGVTRWPCWCQPPPPSRKQAISGAGACSSSGVEWQHGSQLSWRAEGQKQMDHSCGLMYTTNYTPHIALTHLDEAPIVCAVQHAWQREAAGVSIGGRAPPLLQPAPQQPAALQQAGSGQGAAQSMREAAGGRKPVPLAPRFLSNHPLEPACC